MNETKVKVLEGDSALMDLLKEYLEGQDKKATNNAAILTKQTENAQIDNRTAVIKQNLKQLHPTGIKFVLLNGRLICLTPCSSYTEIAIYNAEQVVISAGEMRKARKARKEKVHTHESNQS